MSAALSATASLSQKAASREWEVVSESGAGDVYGSAAPFRGIALGVFLSVPVWMLIGWAVHVVV